MTERLTNPCRNCCESFNGERYSWLPICEHCKERITYEKCLKTAEEQGRLVVLPCKVGAPVCFLRHGFDGWRIDNCKFTYGMIGKFGKTVFLTREEADKALKEMEG